MPATDDLALLVEAARTAGAVARGYFTRGSKAWEKPDAGGPVTEADMAANDALHATLTAARPGYGWLSEESPDVPERLDASHSFVVDPLDGTRAFIEGDHSWSQSLAVVVNGEVAAAVVYLPMRDKLYAAARGHGTTMNGERLSVHPARTLDGATVLSSRRSFEPGHWRAARVPEVRRQFRSSLAYRLSLVGAGRYDAMLRLRPVWEWDVAAGALLVEEAGGRITDRRGAALRFNRPDPRFDGLIAAAPALHADILARLA